MADWFRHGVGDERNSEMFYIVCHVIYNGVMRLTSHLSFVNSLMYVFNTLKLPCVTFPLQLFTPSQISRTFLKNKTFLRIFLYESFYSCQLLLATTQAIRGSWCLDASQSTLHHHFFPENTLSTFCYSLTLALEAEELSVHFRETLTS